MPLNGAVFCSQGLGDGLIFFQVANNLRLNGFETKAYHDFLDELQNSIPFPIEKFPKMEEMEQILSQLDLVIINSDSSERCKFLIALAKKLKPKQNWVLHATTCKGKNLPGDYYLDPSRTMVENLKNFCEKALKLKASTKENGLELFQKEKLTFRKNLQRVAIHPSSADPKRNWPLKKFLHLASLLKSRGYESFFILSHKERAFFVQEIEKEGFAAPEFTSLQEMANFLYESGFFIGNDSGIGHLASALKIPTLTIFSKKRKEKFWLPDWGLSKKVSAYALLPNIKHLRLQDKYWKNLLPVFKVYRAFMSLEQASL